MTCESSFKKKNQGQPNATWKRSHRAAVNWVILLSSNFSLTKHAFLLCWSYSLCQLKTKRKCVTTFILSATALTPLSPRITEDGWYMRLCNCSVITSMCLQARCLPCCHYSLNHSRPVGWSQSRIDLISVQISREQKWCCSVGTEWVRMGWFKSGALRIDIPCKHSLNFRDVYGRRPNMFWAWLVGSHL